MQTTSAVLNASRLACRASCCSCTVNLPANLVNPGYVTLCKSPVYPNQIIIPRRAGVWEKLRTGHLPGYWAWLQNLGAAACSKTCIKTDLLVQYHGLHSDLQDGPTTGLKQGAGKQERVCPPQQQEISLDRLYWGKQRPLIVYFPRKPIPGQ